MAAEPGKGGLQGVPSTIQGSGGEGLGDRSQSQQENGGRLLSKPAHALLQCDLATPHYGWSLVPSPVSGQRYDSFRQ